ncbi:hypothetical protein KAX75_10990 [candidate division WOR-3 bacterium]|nr:hypothetical protein [candidate division WOR-3 bacterium]
MLRYTIFICIAFLFISSLSVQCEGKGKWGVEASTEINDFAFIKSFSLKNELLFRLQYDWTEYFQDKEKGSIESIYPDTTYEEEYSQDYDYSYGTLSLEVGYRKFLGSGKGLSPHIGFAFRVSPGRQKNLSYNYTEDTLTYHGETKRSWYNLSALINVGCRYLFNKHFAVSLHADIVSYVWNKEYYKSTTTYANGRERNEEYTDRSRYLQNKFYPHLYVQYYF